MTPNLPREHAPTLNRSWVFLAILAVGTGLMLSLLLGHPDRPLRRSPLEPSGQPAFRVQIIRPRTALPLGGLIPPQFFGVDADLGFDSSYPGSRSELHDHVFLLSAQAWRVRLVFDDEGQITSETEVVFDLRFEDEIRTVRCRPGSEAIGDLTLATNGEGDAFRGTFHVELPICVDAVTGEALGWPAQPLILEGSFARIPRRQVSPALPEAHDNAGRAIHSNLPSRPFRSATTRKLDDSTTVSCSSQALQQQLIFGSHGQEGEAMKRVCVVGASGKLGRYLVQHALDRGYEVVGVCRPQSVEKLADLRDRITVIPGATNDRDVIQTAVADCDGVLTVLVPWGMQHYASGTARAVLDHAAPEARLIFSCGWHISRDGRDVYSWKLKTFVAVFGWLARVLRVVDIDDQVEACRLIFASSRRWTVVRGSDLEEGPSEGLPVWSSHVGDPILASNRTRRIDFALFMIEALDNDALIQQAPAIVGCQTPSALQHTMEHTA